MAERLKPSSLERRLAGIRKIHWLFELPDPTDHLEVDLAIRRARRKKPQRPNQALGITAAVRDKLLAATSEDLIGLRDGSSSLLALISCVGEANWSHSPPKISRRTPLAIFRSS